MIDNRISAFELRSAGVPVPVEIPDCATIERSAIQYRVKSPSEVNCQTGSIAMSVDLTFLKPFEWVSVDVEIDA